jgi:phosphoglycolate phosphatase
MTKVQGVVFDLDGTLLNSLADIARAANMVLQRHAFAGHDVAAYRSFVGYGVRRLLQQTVPGAYREDAELMERMIEEFAELYRQTWNVQSHLYAGIPELLDQLVRRGVALAVLSNKPQAATLRCVRYFLPQYDFAAVLGQQEGRPPKPDLTGAREILDVFGLAPPACLYLGDTAVDMLTARGAGMIPVGVSWGFREVEELRAAGARRIIDHPRELLPLLD